MAMVNPFDILGDDDNDDPSHLIAIQQQKIAAMKPAAAGPISAAGGGGGAAAKLPSKPVPPAQAMREARESKSNTGAVRGHGNGAGGPGQARGSRGGPMGPNRDPGRDFSNGNANGFYRRGAIARGEDAEVVKLQDGEQPPRQQYNGGRRVGGHGGGYRNGEAGDGTERPSRRYYERRSGTGRGSEMKRNGAGIGNWGAANDETTTQNETTAQEKDEILDAIDKPVATEKQQKEEAVPSPDANNDTKEGAAVLSEEKEEDKEMTLEEYEKIKEEKRKALVAMMAEERKVEIDEELQSMLQLSGKKGNNEVFVKLGSEKENGKKKENADRDEKSKKPVSINQFLKPAEGERYYSAGGRGGRGRGRGGERGSFRGGFGGRSSFSAAAPSIEDPGMFPALGAK